MSGNGSGREMSPEWITSMTPSLFNGERVVVLLYITTILFSSDFSLLPHALALSLLSLTALFLEIFAESSNVFLPLKTRPGASSGILLGAVTLPALNLSKLIQLSRALLLEQVETQEFKYQSSLFWVTSACCYGVLVYMFFVIQCTKRGNGSFSRISWRTMFGCLVICCAMILSTDYDDGLHLVLILSWMVCHSIAAVTLFQHILLTFPLCASIGWKDYRFVVEDKYVPWGGSCHLKTFSGLLSVEASYGKILQLCSSAASLHDHISITSS